VPKVASAEQVRELVSSMEAAGCPERTQLWAMLETPAAVLDAHAIAGASDRLSLLVMGTNDLARELGAEQVPGRHTLLAALGMCLLAARAHGKGNPRVDNDITDEAGFEAECQQGRRLGFDGKTPSTRGRWTCATGCLPPPPGRSRTPERSSLPGRRRWPVAAGWSLSTGGWSRTRTWTPPAASSPPTTRSRSSRDFAPERWAPG